MLRKLKLYGELATFVGHKEFEVQADSIAKVVSFLVNNFPQIEKYMNPKYYQVPTKQEESFIKAFAKNSKATGEVDLLNNFVDIHSFLY